jgi:hypothetical protein
MEGPVIQRPRSFDERSVRDRLPHRPRQWGHGLRSAPLGQLCAGQSVDLEQARRSPTPQIFATQDRLPALFVASSFARSGVTPSASMTSTPTLYCTTDLDLSAVQITATATARDIDSRCVTVFSDPVAAPTDVTDEVRDFWPGSGVATSRPTIDRGHQRSTTVACHPSA